MNEVRTRIWSARGSGLFVSFSTPDGTWTRPASLGKYIFYKAGDDVYRVSAKIVEEPRSEQPEWGA